MREFPARIFGTAQLILFALLPTAVTGPAPGAEGGAEGGAATRGPGAAAPRKCQERASVELEGAAAGELDGALRCDPRRIRGGMGRLLDSRGELRLFFPGCLAIAAPVILFRLKREGFSRCSVEASPQGLLVRGWR